MVTEQNVTLIDLRNVKDIWKQLGEERGAGEEGGVSIVAPMCSSYLVEARTIDRSWWKKNPEV